LAHWEALPYFALSTYRYLQKQDLLHNAEKLVLRYLKNRFLRVTNVADRKSAFIDLYNELVILLDNPLEQNLFRYFDFMTWLIVHIEGRSFKEVVAERMLVHVS
jgi:hypothetical protein